VTPRALFTPVRKEKRGATGREEGMGTGFGQLKNSEDFEEKEPPETMSWVKERSGGWGHGRSERRPSFSGSQKKRRSVMGESPALLQLPEAKN